MQQISFIRNIGFPAAGIGLAMAGGWLGFESTWFEGQHGVETQRFMAGVLMLVFGWRLAGKTRLTGWAVLTSWHLGAGTAIPALWSAFFGNHWGWLALPLWAAATSLPLLLLPFRLMPFGLAIGSLITAISPIGMVSPLLAATAFFPGAAWLGLGLGLFTLALPSIRNGRVFMILVMIFGLAGSVTSTATSQIKSQPGALAVTTHEGRHPSLAIEWFGRQYRVSEAARDLITAGAKLTVTPEGTLDAWDIWGQAAWKKAAETAAERNAMLLVGVYRQQPNARLWENGLINMATGDFYPATLPMPTGMWKPWDDKEHYPIDLGNATRTIQTPIGRAVYVICYEEMLIWPLMAKMPAKPDFVISASNQWFTNSETSVAQTRSVNLQARLWGLPLVRSVNWTHQP